MAKLSFPIKDPTKIKTIMYPHALEGINNTWTFSYRPVILSFPLGFQKGN